MRYEWFLARYKNGRLIDKSPYAMSRSEADNLLSLARLSSNEYTFKVVHKKELSHDGRA